MNTKKTLVVGWICIFSLIAYGDMSVSLPQVSETDIPLNTPTTITVSAQIGADPALNLSSIRLVRYDPVTNMPLGILAQMYDDGTHGDALPGDTRFTGQAVITATQAGPIHLRVTAAYNRVRNRFMSDVIELVVFKPLTDEDFNIANQVLSWAYGTFWSLRQSMSQAAATEEILNAIKANPEVLGANICDDVIFIGMRSGILQILRTSDIPDLKSCSTGVLNSLLPSLLTGFPEDVEKVPGNANILLWAPCATSDGFTLTVGAVRDSVTNGAYFIPENLPLQFTQDEAAGLDSIKTFDDYGLIIIDTHGNWVANDDTWFWPWEWFDHWVVISSGTPNNNVTQNTYSTDIAAHRVITEFSKLYFTPKYITNHLGTMPDSMVYMGACHSMHSDSMWNAFKSKGAKVAYGWTRPVGADFDRDTSRLLFDAMVPKNVPIGPVNQPKTAREAYDAIPDKDDGDAHFEMRVNGSDWNNMYLVTPDIINGGFETGDFKGWTTGGDYNYSAVVSHPHEGSYAGALGRWDQGYLGYNPNIEPYGYEWIYQDVMVPSNATKLSFWYDIETYDTAVWDWVDMYIKNTSGATLKTVLSAAGKPGTNYGPYWHLGWTYVETDVTAYRGQKIRIWFEQRLDGWGDQQRCYFDEVKFIKE
jgi:hypothetical protein